MRHRFFLPLLFALLLPLQAMAIAFDVEQLPDPAQEARARTLMRELRCLVCQNQSIEDSNASLAQDLRKIVRQPRSRIGRTFGATCKLAIELSAASTSSIKD